MNHYMRNLFLIFVSISLFGCGSEIDKCVDAQVKARGKFDDLALKHGATNVATKEEVTAEARLICLQAANGKL
jgi:hypothetical protein